MNNRSTDNQLGEEVSFWAGKPLPEFVADLQRQDETAFRALVQRYSGLVYRQIRLKCGQNAALEDLSQEVFWRVYQALPRFSGTHLGAWIARIARNLCIDEIRKQSRRVKTVEEDDVPQIDGNCGSAQEELPGFLSRLSAIEREVLLLRVLEKMSYKEISELTRIPVNSIGPTIRRALDNMRKVFEKE